ncbi:MAG: hypothetical protein ABI758_02150 [Candidatus Woesebacteria bacterium]
MKIIELYAPVHVEILFESKGGSLQEFYDDIIRITLSGSIDNGIPVWERKKFRLMYGEILENMTPHLCNGLIGQALDAVVFREYESDFKLKKALGETSCKQFCAEVHIFAQWLMQPYSGTVPKRR